MKSKGTAAILALCLGGIGIHKLYLGQFGRFALYLIFSFTFIPMLISVFEAISFLTYSDDQWNKRFNQHMVREDQKMKIELGTLEELKALREEIKNLKSGAA